MGEGAGAHPPEGSGTPLLEETLIKRRYHNAWLSKRDRS